MDEFNKKFNSVSVLGEGRYGKVSLVQDNKTYKFFAAKFINIDIISFRNKKSITGIQQTIQEEVNILRKLSDVDNIIKFDSVFFDDRCVIIIMEYMNGLDMIEYKHDFLRNNNNPMNSMNPISSDLIIHYMTSFCTAMAQVHDRGIIHNDIKPENILIAGNDLKIIDFGLSFIPYPDNNQIKNINNYNNNHNISIKNINICGTPQFFSPEKLDAALNNKLLTIDEYKASDVWAFGITFYLFIHPADEMIDVIHIDNMDNMKNMGHLLRKYHNNIKKMTIPFTYDDGHKKNSRLIRKIISASVFKSSQIRPTFSKLLKILTRYNETNKDQDKDKDDVKNDVKNKDEVKVVVNSSDE